MDESNISKTPEKEGLLPTPKSTPTAEKKAVVVATDKNGHGDGAKPGEKEALLTDTDTAIVPSDQWESSKADKAEEALADQELAKTPQDRYMIVYFILLLHGVGTLMPWNMFITATNYFTDYKLLMPSDPAEYDNNTVNATWDANSTGVPPLEEDNNIYRSYFLSYLGFTAQVPNVILNFINVFCQVKGGSTSLRIIWSIIVVVIMFILTVVLAMLDSSQWVETFFWVTMVSVVIINMANGVYQNSVYGTAAILPMKYTNAVVLGSNISGTLTSVLLLISSASTPDFRAAAIFYFLAAIIVLLVAFDTYYALPFIPFYRFYKKRAREEEILRQDVTTSGTEVNRRPPYLLILKQCWVQYFGVFFVFFVTLTCFPAIMAGVQRSSDTFFIPEKFFMGVTCFLFFNAFAMLGNLTTEWIRKPGPRWVWLPIVIRALFIPFFMFCNFQPKSGIRALPVLIYNDYVYMFGVIIMAFTSGYFSSLTMMYAPKEVHKPENAGVAGMMAAFFLISGIFMGVIFSLPVTIFIENVG